MNPTIRTAAILAIAVSAGNVKADTLLTSEVALPGDVLLRVADLWEHGDRYEAAIEHIIATAALPDWSGGCGCDTPQKPALETAPGM